MRHAIIAMLAALLLLPGLVWADDMQPAPEPVPGDKARRDEALMRLELVRLYRLTELLELDTDEAARLFPLFKQYDEQFRRLQEQQALLFTELTRNINAKKRDEKKIRGLVDQILALEHEAMKIRDAQFEALKKNLNAQQLGKYMLFEKKFQREMNRLLDDVRQKRRRGRRGEMPLTTP